MTDQDCASTTRRSFMQIFLLGGAATVAGVGWHHWRHGSGACASLHGGSLVLKNPAFARRFAAGAVVFVTTTADGHQIMYTVDPPADFMLSNIMSVRDYYAGRRVTVSRLIDCAVAKYADRSSASVRKDAMAFLNEAVHESIVMAPGTYIMMEPGVQVREQV